MQGLTPREMMADRVGRSLDAFSDLMMFKPEKAAKYADAAAVSVFVDAVNAVNALKGVEDRAETFDGALLNVLREIYEDDDYLAVGVEFLGKLGNA